MQTQQPVYCYQSGPQETEQENEREGVSSVRVFCGRDRHTFKLFFGNIIITFCGSETTTTATTTTATVLLEKASPLTNLNIFNNELSLNL